MSDWKTLTFSFTVRVPESHEAGEVATVLAGDMDRGSPLWEVGPLVLEAAPGSDGTPGRAWHEVYATRAPVGEPGDYYSWDEMAPEHQQAVEAACAVVMARFAMQDHQGGHLTVCPLCAARARADTAPGARDTLDQYASLPLDAWFRVLAKAGVPLLDDVAPYKTFREEWTVAGARTGVIMVSYAGGCRACGLRVAFTHDHRVPARPLRDERGTP